MTKRNLLVLWFIAMLGAVGCALQERKPAYDGWSLAAPLPVPNSETAVAAIDGKIYVIGAAACGAQSRYGGQRQQQGLRDRRPDY